MALQRRVMCPLFLLVYMVNGVAALNCVVHVQYNGSALCSLSEAAKPGCDIDWSVAGVAVANEEEFNSTLVIGRTNSSLLLYEYHPRVKYEVNCQGRRQVVTCNVPTPRTVPTPEASYDRNSGVTTAAPVAAPLVAAIALVLALLSLAV